MYDTSPDDKDVDDIIRNARLTLDHHVTSAMPCIAKRERDKEKKTCCGGGQSLTTFRESKIKAFASRRCFIDFQKRLHTDLVADKGFHSWDHYILAHTELSTPKSYENSRSQSGLKSGINVKTNIAALDSTHGRCRSAVIAEANAKNAPVHFAMLLDFCDLKLPELAGHLQKLKGRFVLCGDTVKDDTVGYTVFTEQGASASHMTAATVLETMSRLRRSKRCSLCIYPS